MEFLIVSLKPELRLEIISAELLILMPLILAKIISKIIKNVIVGIAKYNVFIYVVIFLNQIGFIILKVNKIH